MSANTSSLIVMTGATSGLGLEAAKVLATRESTHLVVGARKPESANTLRTIVPANRLTVLPLDTSSLLSVREFSDAVEDTRHGVPITALALNAGVQTGTELELTEDGVERTFATNYLGHFLLVERLKARLASDAAVIFTSSQSHDPADRIARILGYRGAKFKGASTVARGELDMSASTAQQARDRYATSKFCGLLWTFAMVRGEKNSGVRFLAYDPGAVPATQIVRELGVGARLGWSRLLPRVAPILPGFSTPEASGRTLARLLTEPRLAPESGMYLDYRGQPARLWDAARREDWQDELIQVSRELVGGIV